MNMDTHLTQNNPLELQAVIEALLLMSAKPVSANTLAEVIIQVHNKQAEENPIEVKAYDAHTQDAIKRMVKDTLDALMVFYKTDSRPIARGWSLQLVEGGYQLATIQEVAPFIQHYLSVQPSKLSRAQLEILAIIAYKQPITRAEIDLIRGVDCSGLVKVLLDRKLVRIMGRKEEPGRPHIYGTTSEFLNFFRIRSLTELPTLRELHELNQGAEQLNHQEDKTKEQPSIQELAASVTQSFFNDDSHLLETLDSTLAQIKIRDPIITNPPEQL